MESIRKVLDEQEKENIILRLNHITKIFSGIKVLDDVCFSVRKGEIHALIGANGAGKSTLIKIIAGLYKQDGGTVDIGKQENVHLKNTNDAQKLGVSVVFQELTVFPDLNVMENIFANREITKNGFYKWKEMKKRTREILEELEVDFNPDDKVSSLSIAQQQMVEIAKAVSFDAEIIILDEPTSSLSKRETEKLFEVMRKLHGKGITLIFISHRLDEIYENCERITLLRDGKWILTEELSDMPKKELINQIIGRKMEEEFPPKNHKIGEELLRVENFNSRSFHDVNFVLNKGEVLGFAGLVGAGRTEMAKSIFGEYPRISGNVYLNGKKQHISSSSAALKNGIAYATEDRKMEGLFPARSIKENMVIASLKEMTRMRLINKKLEKNLVNKKINELQIKAGNINQDVMNLSGGNQQKVCLAKWLLTSPEVLILDEPTRGIDVGARAEFYKIINELALKGVGIIVISSEEGELIGLCDRIIVMYEGNITGEIHDVDDCKEVLTQYMLGVKE